MVAPPFTPTTSSFPSLGAQLLSMQNPVTVKVVPSNGYVTLAEFDPTVSVTVMVVALARGAAETNKATMPKARVRILRLMIRTTFVPPSGI